MITKSFDFVRGLDPWFDSSTYGWEGQHTIHRTLLTHSHGNDVPGMPSFFLMLFCL